MADNSNLINLEVVEREFSSDPLFNLIKRKKKLQQIFDNEYIVELEKLTWYSTTSIAPMCDTTTSQIQYYVRNFLEYLEVEETPSTGNAFRLDYKAVIRLKMIFILKDEYKTKGLKQELGYENIVKSAKPIRLSAEGWLDQNQDQLEQLISFINNSGFVLVDDESNEVEVNPYIIKTLKMIPQVLELIQDSAPTDIAISAAKDKKRALEENIKDKELLKQILVRTHGLEFREKSKVNQEPRGFFSMFKRKDISEPVVKHLPAETDDPQILLIDEKIQQLESEISQVDDVIKKLEIERTAFSNKIQALLGGTQNTNDNLNEQGVLTNESKKFEPN